MSTTEPNRQPLEVLMEDEFVHTDARPFCSDMTCPCHDDTDLLQEYLIIPTDLGFLAEGEAIRIFNGL